MLFIVQSKLLHGTVLSLLQPTKFCSTLQCIIFIMNILPYEVVYIRPLGSEYSKKPTIILYGLGFHLYNFEELTTQSEPIICCGGEAPFADSLSLMLSAFPELIGLPIILVSLRSRFLHFSQLVLKYSMFTVVGDWLLWIRFPVIFDVDHKPCAFDRWYSTTL